MDYRDIVSVTGIGGLFHLLATKSDGAIVRNISDNSTKFISARLHNVTPLESIEVYTTTDNVRLHEVFQKMKDAEAATPIPSDSKKSSGDDIKNYFSTIFPDFDQERVYVSDMKKMLKWYQMLKEKDLLNFDHLNAADETETEESAEEVAPKEEKKPAKKAAKKKAEPATDADNTEEKPAKKATKKKAATKKADGEAKKPAAKKTAKKKTEE